MSRLINLNSSFKHTSGVVLRRKQRTEVAEFLTNLEILKGGEYSTFLYSICLDIIDPIPPSLRTLVVPPPGTVCRNRGRRCSTVWSKDNPGYDRPYPT